MSAPLSALLQQANHAHQAGDLAAAERLYTEVLQQDSHHAEALRLLGAIAQQRGNFEGALQLYGKVLGTSTTTASLFNNIGSCLHQLQRHAEALEALDQALRIDAQYLFAWINRGNVLRSLQRFQEAIDSYQQAMELRVDHHEAYYQRGLCLQSLDLDHDAVLDFADALRFVTKHGDTPARMQFAYGLSLQKLGDYQAARAAYIGALEDESSRLKTLFNLGLLASAEQDHEEALRYFDAAILLDGQHLRGHLQRAHTLRRLGRSEDAAQAYHTAGRYGLDQAQLDFYLASLGQQTSPANAPAEYVRELFDQYAPHFEQHLLSNLEYRLPSLLAHELSQRLQPRSVVINGMDGKAENHDGRSMHCLDLGCGTGLCGSLLRDYATHLIGVDLSPAMLQVASAREIYDDLICAELVDYLDHHQQKVDLILMADVLAYFGDLTTVFRACHDQLNRDGLMIFTVEAIDNALSSSASRSAYILQSSQRFAHDADYLRELALQCDWQVEEMRLHALRREGEQVLHAWLCIWKKK